jgi:choline-sulfatase
VIPMERILPAGSAEQYSHVVLVSIDTLRSDAIAANPFKLWPAKYPGITAPKTDILDELARTGAFFPNMVSAAPYTAASHGAILTGQFPLRNGIYEFYNGRLKSPSIFTYGRRSGRAVIMKVDFPIILGPELGFTRDVNEYFIEDDDKFITSVVSATRAVAFAHFGGVHLPYGFHNLRFGGDDYRSKVAELERLVPDDAPPQVEQLVESFRDPADLDLLFRYKHAMNSLYMAGRYNEMFQIYLEGIEYFLANRFTPFIERLSEGLRAAGRKMLLVIFADHGHEFDARSYGHFNSMAEGVLRVPLIIHGDGVAPGMHSQRIRTVDIVPTVAELAGINTPKAGVFDGASRAAVAAGAERLTSHAPAVAEAYNSDTREFVEFQRQQLSGGRPAPLRHVLTGQAAYLGSRRLSRRVAEYAPNFVGMESVDEIVVERFDDDLVPHPEPGGDTAELLSMLSDYRSSLEPAVQVDADEEIRQQLRSLGYPI